MLSAVALNATTLDLPSVVYVLAFSRSHDAKNIFTPRSEMAVSFRNGASSVCEG